MPRHWFVTEQYQDRKPLWWWFLCMPGAATMWFDYMFPDTVRGAFGAARRRNVWLLQFFRTMLIYALGIGAVYLWLSSRDSAAG